jgi:WXG100 family type VII secretion target
MVKIRIDTERVRDVGIRFSSESDHLRQINHELRQAIGSLDTGAWDGRSRADAEPLLDRVRPESLHVAKKFDDLGQKLLHVADMFERKDDTAAQNLERMPWVDFDSAKLFQSASRLGVKNRVIKIFDDIFDRIKKNTVLYHNMKDLMEYLESTSAGQNLIQQAKEKGVGFLLPDGTIFGDKDGSLVEVYFGDTSDIEIGGKRSQGGFNPAPPQVMLSDLFGHRNQPKNDQAAVLGHEMQHALDHFEGKLRQADRSVLQSYRNDPRQLESYLSEVVQSRVESEVRADARKAAIKNSTSFSDDGVLSHKEAVDIMEHQEDYYENYYNDSDEFPELSGYEIGFWVDEDGNIQTNVVLTDLLF